MDKHIPKTKQVFSNYRIIVNIDEPWLPEKDPQKAHAQCVAKLTSVVGNIRRHVDDVTQVLPHWDTEAVCIYCGYIPESDPETGAPVCCNKAVADYDAAHEKAVR